jgi:hypothetical protein
VGISQGMCNEIAPDDCDAPISKFPVGVNVSKPFDFIEFVAVNSPLDDNVPLIAVLNPDAPIDTALLPDVPIDTNPVFVDAKVKAPPHVILTVPFVEPKVILPVVAVRPNAVPLIVVVDNVPLIVVVIPDAPIVNAVAVDVPNDNVPADAVVSDGDVKAETFITPVELIEPVFEPFLTNVPIIFPDDAVIFPLVSVIPVVKVGFESGAYVVDASADVK